MVKSGIEKCRLAALGLCGPVVTIDSSSTNNVLDPIVH